MRGLGKGGDGMPAHDLPKGRALAPGGTMGRLPFSRPHLPHCMGTNSMPVGQRERRGEWGVAETASQRHGRGWAGWALAG